MKLASICMRKAKHRQSAAGRMLNLPYIKASAHPKITGIAAPVKVLGRAASIHALNELVCIMILSVLIAVLFFVLFAVLFAIYKVVSGWEW